MPHSKWNKPCNNCDFCDVNNCTGTVGGYFCEHVCRYGDGVCSKIRRQKLRDDGCYTMACVARGFESFTICELCGRHEEWVCGNCSRTYTQRQMANALEKQLDKLKATEEKKPTPVISYDDEEDYYGLYGMVAAREGLGRRIVSC